MKWIKRLLVFVCIVLATIATMLGIGYYKYKSTPSWYRPRVMTEQQKADAANSADQKLLDLVNWAASVQAQETRLRRKPTAHEVVIGPKTVTLTDDEINSLAEKWARPEQGHAREQVSKYFRDGRLVLDGGKLILVGNSPQFGALTSASFTPWIDEKGQFWLKLDGLAAGTLPIPQAMISDQLKQLQSGLQSLISDYQTEADIDSTGVANAPAAKSAMTRQLLDSLNDQPSNPVLFIPADLGSGNHHYLPVWMTAVKAGQGALTLTLAPMTAADRATLLEEIKHPAESQASAGE